MSLSTYYTANGIGFRTRNFARHVATVHSEVPSSFKRRLDNIDSILQKRQKENIGPQQFQDQSNQDQSSAENSSRFDELENTIKQLTSDKTELERKVHAMEGVERLYNISLAANRNLETELAGMKKTASTLKEHNDKLLKANVVMNNNIQTLTDGKYELEVRYKDLAQSYSKLEADMNKLTNDTLAMKNEIEQKAELEKSISALEERNDQLFNANVTLNRSIAKLSSIGADCEAERNKLVADNLAMKNELEQYGILLQTHKQLKDENDNLLHHMEKMKHEIKDLELCSSFDRAMSPKPEMANDLELRSKLDALEINLFKIQSELYSLQIQRRDLLHSYLDLQGKVRVMARLCPSDDPMQFNINSNQNRLERKY